MNGAGFRGTGDAFQYYPVELWQNDQTLGSPPLFHRDGAGPQAHPDAQPARDYLYWEHHLGKQQAVRLGHWKGLRIGGTKEPLELYDLETDVGVIRNVAAQHPEVVARIESIMQEARANSEFNQFWPPPEFLQPQIKMDTWLFDQREHGIR